MTTGTIQLAVDHQSQFDSFTSSASAGDRAFVLANWHRVQGYSTWLDDNADWLVPVAWEYEDSYAIKQEFSDFDDLKQYVLRRSNNYPCYIRFGGTQDSDPADILDPPAVPPLPQYAGDVGDTDFQDWYIAKCLDRVNVRGFAGIWVDDVNLARGFPASVIPVSDGFANWVDPENPRTASTMTEAEWNGYFVTYMQRLRDALPDAELNFNLYWGSPKDGTMDSVHALADYVNIERGFLDAGITKGSGSFGFDTMLTYIDGIHARGAKVVLDYHRTVLGGSPSHHLTDGEMDFAVACYLLVKQEGDLFCIEDETRVLPSNWDARLSVDLGEAIGMYVKSGDVYTRSFERGTVTVDLSGGDSVATGATLNWTGTTSVNYARRYSGAAKTGGRSYDAQIIGTRRAWDYRNYGLRDDPDRDQSRLLQDLIDDAADRSRGSPEHEAVAQVRLPPFMMRASGLTVPGDNVEVVGSGRTGTTIKALDAAAAPIFTCPKIRFRLRGLALNGARNGQDLVNFDGVGSWGATLDDLLLYGCDAHAIRNVNVGSGALWTTFTLTNSTIQGGDAGFVLLTNPAAATIRRCSFRRGGVQAGLPFAVKATANATLASTGVLLQDLYFEFTGDTVVSELNGPGDSNVVTPVVLDVRYARLQRARFSVDVDVAEHAASVQLGAQAQDCVIDDCRFLQRGSNAVDVRCVAGSRGNRGYALSGATDAVEVQDDGYDNVFRELSAAPAVVPSTPQLLTDVRAARGDGFRGWTGSDKIIQTNSKAIDAHLRGWWNNSLSGEPTVSSDQAYEGTDSFKLDAQNPAAGASSRSQIVLIDELHGFKFFRHLVDYWMSFVFYDPNTTFGGTWEQYWQCHDGGEFPKKTGYGSSASPPIGLYRVDDTQGRFELRSNAPSGVLNLTLTTAFTWPTAQWVRVILNWRLASYDSGELGYARCWLGTGSAEPTKVMDSGPRLLGYDYNGPDGYDQHNVSLGLYENPPELGKNAYCDLLRASDDPNCTVVNMDPLNLSTRGYWV